MNVTLRRLLMVVGWLFLGHIAVVGLYWLLLNVPESNVLALTTSVVLMLAQVIALGLTNVTGLLWMRAGSTWRQAFARSVRVLPAFILALLVFATIFLIVGAFELRYVARTSEVDAWLIAKFNWTRTAWLHRVVAFVFTALRYVISLSLAVSLVAFTAVEGYADIFRLRWLWRALSPGQLVIIAIAMVGLFWLPWQYVYWRPAAIPPNTLELIFIGVKLVIIGWLINLGVAMILWAPQRRPLR